MMQWAWFIPVFPLISFILILLIGNRIKEKSAYLAILLSFLSVILSFFVLLERAEKTTYQVETIWFSIGNIDITSGYSITALNSLMLLIVSLISFLVHIYSMGYMKGHQRFSTFYGYLGLFTFSMLALVMTTNLLQLYVFWELVGLGSFLLIGFYFEKEAAKKAAKKAFIMTRIGDVGLFIAMILLFWQVESFRYEDIFQAVESGSISPGLVTAIAILIFIGAMGKSGQFPLHTWLPDAMEGPTPVSALIHAATMVAAGVYLVASLYPVFLASEVALMVVAIIGGFTAIFAASIALVQKDIKRILAYSTVSQLGYMMLGLGAFGYVAAIFHLTTHAFFKALLFLAAGSVIHAVGTQNIENMGGLKEKMRFTMILFLIGALSLSGVPLFSGFFSKEAILIATLESGHGVLLSLALITTFLTSFYMFRLFFLVFSGNMRGETKAVHESPKNMVWPMAILAVLSILVGYIDRPFSFNEWLLMDIHFNQHHSDHAIWIMILSIVLSLFGIALAYMMYHPNGMMKRDRLSLQVPFFYNILVNKYYVDEFYEKTVIKVTKMSGIVLHWFDRFIIEGVMNGVASFTQFIGRQGANLQNGQTQMYSTIAFFGLAIFMIIYAVIGGGW